jgi:hypothetical protein
LCIFYGHGEDERLKMNGYQFEFISEYILEKLKENEILMKFGLSYGVK